MKTLELDWFSGICYSRRQFLGKWGLGPAVSAWSLRVTCMCLSLMCVWAQTCSCQWVSTFPWQWRTEVMQVTGVGGSYCRKQRTLSWEKKNSQAFCYLELEMGKGQRTEATSCSLSPSPHSVLLGCAPVSLWTHKLPQEPRAATSVWVCLPFSWSGHCCLEQQLGFPRNQPVCVTGEGEIATNRVCLQGFEGVTLNLCFVICSIVWKAAGSSSLCPWTVPTVYMEGRVGTQEADRPGFQSRLLLAVWLG